MDNLMDNIEQVAASTVSQIIFSIWSSISHQDPITGAPVVFRRRDKADLGVLAERLGKYPKVDGLQGKIL